MSPRDVRLAAMQERMQVRLKELCIQLLALPAAVKLRFPLNLRRAEQFIAANVSLR